MRVDRREIGLLYPVAAATPSPRIGPSQTNPLTAFGNWPVLD